MTAEGDNRVLLQKVAKETLALLSKGKHAFPEVAASSHPINIERADLNDLFALFVMREQSQLLELAEQMQSKMGAGKKLFDVSVALCASRAQEGGGTQPQVPRLL